MITLSGAALVIGSLECIGQVYIGGVSDMVTGYLLTLWKLSFIEPVCLRSM